jgi:hypothetical protein
MKLRLLASLLIIALLPLQNAEAETTNYISVKQTGSALSLTWKYKSAKPKSQQLLVQRLEKDLSDKFYVVDEDAFKLTSSQRSKKLTELDLNTTYRFTIIASTPSIKIVKEYQVLNKPTSATDLSYSWNNNKPVDNLTINWLYDGAKVTNWIISIYKSNIPDSATGLPATLEESISSEDSESAEMESIIKKYTIKGSLRSYSIPNLKKEESYRILLEAKNQSGTGLFSNLSVEQSAPNAPTNVTVTESKSKNNEISLAITWEYAGPDVTSFTIGVRASGSKEDLNVYKVSANSRTFVLNKLSKGGYYQFVVRAVNNYSYGTAISEPFLIKIPVSKPKDPLQEKIEDEAGGPIDIPEPVETQQPTPTTNNSSGTPNTGNPSSLPIIPQPPSSGNNP